MSLTVKSNPKPNPENVQAQELINKMEELFVGLDNSLVVNVIGSYVVSCFVEMNDRNEHKTEQMLKQYHKGLINISKSMIADMKKNDN